MSAQSYKQLKEDFVSGLSGGSVGEINWIASVAAASVALWSVLQARQAFFTPYTPLACVIDFLLNVAGILLATTIHSSSPALLTLLFFGSVGLLHSGLPRPGARRRKKPRGGGLAVASATSADVDDIKPKSASRKDDGLKPPPVPTALSIKPFLTTYRGVMLVTTSIAILAVDFRIFPRRFAKVETWGTSFMDLGVGSFVFSAGVVGARPVLLQALANKEGAGGPPPLSLSRRLLASLRHSLPLLALGTIRMLSVKGLDYAEHVTEYGVHWNFFFTLGCLPPFVTALQSALALIPSYAVLSVMMAGVYEVLLHATPLQAYILTAPRTGGLVSMNREGIFSFCGYLAIYLAGQDTGMFVLPRSPRESVKDNDGDVAAQRRKKLMMTLAFRSVIWTGLYYLSTSYDFGLNLTVSRRLANLPYVLWVAAFNSTQILAYCCIETVFFPAFVHAADGRAEKEAHDAATSRLLRAINRNGLALFLLANLLTGLVNLTVPTLHVGPPTAMGVLTAYMAVLSGVALGLDWFNIVIKL